MEILTFSSNELSAPDEIQVNKYLKKLDIYNRIHKRPKTIRKKKSKTDLLEDAGEEEVCHCPTTKCQKTGKEKDVKEEIASEKPSEEPNYCADEALMYVPGELTNENDRHESYKHLDDLHKSSDIKTSEHGFPQHKTYYQLSTNVKPINNIQEISNNHKIFKLDEAGLAAEQILHEKNSVSNFCVEQLSKQPSSDLLSAEKESEMSCLCKLNFPNPQNNVEVKAYLETMKNFELAKELHKVNLEHNPLPDKVNDELFLQMQMKERHKDPGLAIKGENFATAIGWKGHKGFGANRCTKLKVFRPKTSPEAKHFQEDNQSITSFDKKWRFIKQNKVRPIEMAICWDLSPVNVNDEPKPPKHVDGSNGSVAPAVFTMVHTPKSAPNNERNEPTSGRNMPALFTQVQEHENVHKVGECIEHRPKTTSHHSESKYEDLKRVKSAYNLHNNKQFCDAVKHYKSSPNLPKQCNDGACCNRIFNNRLCVACELKSVPTKTKPKEEYKMAFKAGVPNSKTSASSSSHITIRVPKPKIPYSKKTYHIDSLNAPFSLQKDKREDYPDHWRLASVYQHSYKPIHLRKKTFLQSVYQ